MIDDHSRGRLAERGSGSRDDLGAVNEVGCVLADYRELGHGFREGCGHPLLLVDESLPCACRPGV